MKTETKHTPLPWHVGKQHANKIIYNQDGWAVGDCVVHHRRFDDAEPAMNANFIVTACNNYERVIAERDELAGLVRVIANMKSTEENYEPDADNALAIMDELIQSARAALAKIGESK